jgi:leucyl aminopeptidase (aminopeptidase T)
MSTKRNIVIDESMWTAIHKAIGRETSVTGERLTASGFIRRAVERDLARAGVPLEDQDGK